SIRPLPGFLWKAAALSLGLALFGFGPASAQDFRAKLTVTVTDPSGLAVPSADLELTNAATGEASPAKSGENGIYSYLFLQPGTYNLKVTAPGFKPAARQNIALQSYQASGID